MKRISKALVIAFGLLFLGATLLNIDLIRASRAALSSGVFRDKSTIPAARFHILVILPEGRDTSFFSGFLGGILDSAEKKNAAVQILRYTEDSESEAERFFEIGLNAGVDGIIMYIPKTGRLMAYAQQAEAAGTAFVPASTNPPPEGLRIFIGSSAFRHGQAGGSFIRTLNVIPRVGLILGPDSEGLLADDPIYQGIRSELGSAGKIVAVARSRPGLFSGEETAALMIRQNPSINILFCADAKDSAGVAQLIVDMNRVRDIAIIGTDDSPEINRYLEKGVIAASVLRDARTMGRESLESVMRINESRDFIVSTETGVTIKTGNRYRE